MTRRLFRACAVLLCCGLTATACAAGDEDSARPRPAQRDSSLPAWKPTTADVPRGKGGKLASDVNGDGYGDVVLPVVRKGKSSLTVVYGSRKGLDLATRTVLPAPGARLTPDGPARTGDLDGDGYADLVGLFAEAVEDPAAGGGSGNTEPGKPFAPHIVWGGPGGPDPSEEPTPLAVTGPPEYFAGQPGDFDGDGHMDLALPRADRLELRYGPFERDGSAARTSLPWRVPSRVEGSDCCHDDIGWLTAGDANGDAATDLVVRPSSDGEQTAGVLLLGGRPGGPYPGAEHRLPTGDLSAFGDFDGDGTGDVVVGDSGSRNNEAEDSATPGDLAPLKVVYGSRSRTASTPPEVETVPGSEALGLQLAAADLNGDGKDELITRYGTDLEAILEKDVKGVVVLNGRTGGLLGKDRRRVRITGPERHAGKAVKPIDRLVSVVRAGDFGAPGSGGSGDSGELILSWSRELAPARWWISRGGSAEDGLTFTSEQLTSR
ncbi:VCBS repeat-containing protein [Streptomyces sp. NPDC050658]|uniref:FG-GAP repeat domain-containing protein n=1 Tax=unclassified Streptomyces TaxID=2593676 RepID=UPI00342C4452